MQPRASRMPFQRYHGALKQIATTAQLGCCALLLATLYSPVAAGAAGLTVVTERLEESTFGNRTAFYVLVANNSDRLQRVDLSGYDERWEPTGRLEFPQRQLWVPAGERRRALVVRCRRSSCVRATFAHGKNFKTFSMWPCIHAAARRSFRPGDMAEISTSFCPTEPQAACPGGATCGLLHFRLTG